MKGFLKELEMLSSLMLLGAIYGVVIVIGLLLTGNNSLDLAHWDEHLLKVLTGLIGVIGSGSVFDMNGAKANSDKALFFVALVFFFINLTSMVLTLLEALALALALDLLLGILFKYLAKRKSTTTEALIEKHLAWIFSMPMAIFRWLSSIRSSVTRNPKLEIKQRAWDVSLIITFTQEIAVVFPEEWDEWQHWISDMMDSRTRMQSKGMNYRLVSLITFYRLTRFAMHIGIDKVFILATRRTTR